MHRRNNQAGSKKNTPNARQRCRVDCTLSSTKKMEESFFFSPLSVSEESTQSKMFYFSHKIQCTMIIVRNTSSA